MNEHHVNSNRKYELKARAESQRETRDRIAQAAAELHEEKGVAHTTVAEIARRAGVTRLTVYNHFADLSELLPACAAHYERLHPPPDFATALAQADPGARVRARSAGSRVVPRDRADVRQALQRPRLRARARPFPRAEHRSHTREPRRRPGRRLRRPRPASRAPPRAVRVALDFWTWRRLTREGLDDEDAADLMTAAVAAGIG